ncbi:MAG: FimB/Mfa2 family fimbrial subunit [Mucinivorans sp.]
MIQYSLIGFASLFLGCVNEDNSECSVGPQVQYYYTLNREREDLFGQRVRKMAIYIFDKNDLFYDSKLIDDPSQLRNNQPLTLDLPSGQYTLISWGGKIDSYEIGEMGAISSGLYRGITKLSDFRLAAPSYLEPITNHTVVREPAELYHGRPTPITVSNQSQQVRIPLLKNTHTINLSISGLSFLAAAPTTILDFHSLGNNSLYKHDNTFGEPTKTIKYLPSTLTWQGDKLRSSVKVLRLMIGHPLTLVVSNKTDGTKYFNFDLLPYIMQSPAYQNQDDLDTEDEFNVDLTIGHDIQITMQINGWQIINVIPQ